MTPEERNAEYTYRVTERLAILCGDRQPKLSELYAAQQEAAAACDDIDRLDFLNHPTTAQHLLL